MNCNQNRYILIKLKVGNIIVLGYFSLLFHFFFLINILYLNNEYIFLKKL